MAIFTGALTNAAGQNLFVVNVSLNPGHKLLDVGRCSHLGRALVVLIVLPEILEPSQVSMMPVRGGGRVGAGSLLLLVGRLHLRARLRRAELCDSAIKEVDLVVEIHH